jgi:hypothetical protein
MDLYHLRQGLHVIASSWDYHGGAESRVSVRGNSGRYNIPCKENKCWKNFKIMRKSLFKYSLYSHPEIGNFRV